MTAPPAPPTAPPRPGPGLPALSRPQKAAVVVSALMAQGLLPDLSGLPEAEQAALAREVSALRRIDRITLDSVLREFLAELDSLAIPAPGSLDRTLELLGANISEATAQRLRMEAGIGRGGDPWDRLSALGPERLLPVLETETAEISAIILSKLRTSKAADLLSQLPGARARRITLSISRIDAIATATVTAIGHALIESLDSQPRSAFSDGPVTRVGAILNTTTAAIRDEVLEGLESVDADFASAVRKAIFTFANIPDRLAPRDVPRVLRDIDEAMVVTALAAAKDRMPAVVDFILTNLSTRMADQLRELLAERARPTDRDGETAMSAIVTRIREMESGGDLVLVSEPG